MPGTVHDTSAMYTRSMWKADGVVQLSDELELKVIIIMQVTSILTLRACTRVCHSLTHSFILFIELQRSVITSTHRLKNELA